MPILPPSSPSPPTLPSGSLLRNAYSLRELVKRRVPGYDDTDVLAAVNDAYRTIWDQILQLDDSYYTRVQTVTVATQNNSFDFLYNENGALTTALSNRFFQIDRIRIQQPGDTQMYSAQASTWNEPAFLSNQQQVPLIVSTTPPYRYIPMGRASVYFARPLPVGVLMEVTYTFNFLEMGIIGDGTVSSSGTAVTGTGTFFTQLLSPDFQINLPGATPAVGQDYEIGADLIANGQTFAVQTIASNTSLTLFNTPSPAFASNTFILSTVPDIPQAYIRVVADFATRNMFSTNAENAQQFEIWAAMCSQELGQLKDGVMQRQRQNNARVSRFPYGIVRRARFSGVQ